MYMQYKYSIIRIMRAIISPTPRIINSPAMFSNDSVTMAARASRPGQVFTVECRLIHF